MFNFGERLRQIRRERGLTQKQFAEKIGSTERGIQHYERGDREPAFRVILAILDNIDVDANYLFGRSDNSTRV